MLIIFLVFNFFLTFSKIYTTSAQIECDFENSFCGYIPNSFMIRYSGPSPSKSSGPLGDHTTGDGYYGLCYGSLLINLNDTCELKQSVTLDTARYFQFYYYMYGRQIGEMLVVINDTIIWSLSGSQEDEWLLSEKLVLPKGYFELKFVGNRSENGRISSDIAIDDLELLEDFPFTTILFEESTTLGLETASTFTNDQKTTTSTTTKTSTTSKPTERTTTTTRVRLNTTTKTTILTTKTSTPLKTSSLNINANPQSQSQNNYLIYIYIFVPIVSIVSIVLIILVVLALRVKGKRKERIKEIETKSLNSIYYNVIDDHVQANSQNK